MLLFSTACFRLGPWQTCRQRAGATLRVSAHAFTGIGRWSARLIAIGDAVTLWA